jgi:hypothetical protein
MHRVKVQKIKKVDHDSRLSFKENIKKLIGSVPQINPIKNSTPPSF